MYVRNAVNNRKNGKVVQYFSLCGKNRSQFMDLCDLQEKNGLDMGKNYHNEMKCDEFVSSIGAVCKGNQGC